MQPLVAWISQMRNFELDSKIVDVYDFMQILLEVTRILIMQCGLSIVRVFSGTKNSVTRGLAVLVLCIRDLLWNYLWPGYKSTRGGNIAYVTYPCNDPWTLQDILEYLNQGSSVIGNFFLLIQTNKLIISCLKKITNPVFSTNQIIRLD